MKKLKIIIVLALVLIPVFAQAALVNCGGTKANPNQCTISGLIFLIIRLINLLFSFAGIVALALVFWGGWTMMTAGGNEEKIKAGKQTLTNAMVGLFLIMAAYVLIDFVIITLSGGKINFGNIMTFF